jgi:hypothetical protein
MSYQKVDIDDIQIPNSNNLGAKDIFALREAYDKVYTNAIPSYNFNDGKNIFYGRIDNENNTVHVNETHLKQISTSKQEAVFCLNFVTDAFVDMRRFIRVNYAPKLQPDNFLTTNWDARRGWQSPHLLYQNKMDELYQVFVKGNLSLKKNEDKISDVDKFVEIFLDDFYPSIQDKIPLTKSGVIMSKYCNPSSTGLCVEIARQNFSLEFVKFQDFLKSPNFKLYALIAAKHGFLIDKNAPWRLVANLKSPAMQKYMANYNLTYENIFDSCYVRTYEYDIQNLKVYLKQMYAAFSSLSPTYIKENDVFNNQKCPTYKQTKQIAVPRKKIDPLKYDETYDDLFWLKIYYRIKLNEIGVALPPTALSIEMNNLEQNYNYVDFDSSLSYINQKIKTQLA